MRILRQSTAVTVVVGPAISDEDGIATVDAATVTEIDCGIRKHGAAGAAITLSASGGDNDMVACANNPGHYDLELTTGNTDTVGPLRLTFNDPDVLLPFWEDFIVVEEAVYDALYASGGTVASAAAVADAVCDEALSGHTGAGSVGKAITDVLDDTATSGVAVAAASVSAIQSGLSTLDAAGVTAAVPTAAENADAVHDEVFAGTTTFRQLERIIAAVLVGKATGGGTTTVTFRDIADTKDVVVETVDENGNRSSVVLTLT